MLILRQQSGLLKEAMGELRQEIQRYGSSGRQSDIEEQKNGEVTEK